MVAIAPLSPEPIAVEARSCDLCGGADLASIWEFQHVAKTRERHFLWSVRVVVCKNCGFGFASPAPTAAALAAYYGNSYLPLKGQARDYSIEARLTVIGRHHAGPKGCYVEIGSNDNTEFAQALGQRFEAIRTVELNDASGATTTDAKDIADGSADIVASYFVLEHVPDVHGFLAHCARIVRPKGAVIVEVPDLRLYPSDPSSLLLHEHVNHFTPNTLTALAARHGLALREVGRQDCSRSFGFVAVFAPDPTVTKAIAAGPNPAEFAEAVACIRDGRAAIDAFDARLAATREKLAASVANGGSAVIWCANEVCRRLLDDAPPPKGVVIVDSNPLKANFLESVPVLQPEAAAESIRRARLFAICSPLYVGEIKNRIERIAGPNRERTYEVIDKAITAR